MKQYHHLTRTERCTIEELLNLDKTQTYIAKHVGVDRSTISRELKRNSNTKLQYFAHGAQASAISRKPHPIAYADKRKIKGILEHIIIEKLNQRWSPEQICGRLQAEFGEKFKLCHETIYRYLWMDRKCGGELFKTLRRVGRRRSRYKNKRRFLYVREPRKFIDQRPQDANNRSEFGHWERDLMHGNRGGPALLTIVYRKSRFTILNLVQSKFSKEVTRATQDTFKRHSDLALQSITNDNGAEFGNFKDLENRLNIPIYYTSPYRSWERGTNENTNGLLRQIFKKGVPIDLKHEQLEAAEDFLNDRPRKMFGYRTPKEIMFTSNQKLFKTIAEYKNELQKSYEQNLIDSFAVALG